MVENYAAEGLTSKKVAIVGGGLAGLAAAVALAGRGLQVELFEAKQSLGGRAGSFRDPESGELIDHCQHVAMGCCTNFLHFCERTGCGDLLERHQRLHFFSADGQRSDFAASRWLPAPLHLLPALWGMKYLNWRDKTRISEAMLALMRIKRTSWEWTLNADEWLAAWGQTHTSIERFWKVVLVSALADSLDNVSLESARQVFVDGFLAHRSAADVYIPRVPLAVWYECIAKWLTARGVQIRLGEPVESIGRNTDFTVVVNTNRDQLIADYAIVAVPWKQVRPLFADSLAAIPRGLVDEFESSPISSVHLWTDRPIMDLPHAVLIERLSQWIFARRDRESSVGHYYQVVISASRELAGRPKDEVIDEVWRDLQAVFPEARDAQLKNARLVTQRDAVFGSGLVEGVGCIRPHQKTSFPPLFLAGDWTATGWPATMEGAVRSGYLAAERVLQSLGNNEKILQSDLPRGWLARLLIR